MTVNDGEALAGGHRLSMASLPLGTPVELEVIFEAAGQRRRDQCSVASPGGSTCFNKAEAALVWRDAWRPIRKRR